MIPQIFLFCLAVVALTADPRIPVLDRKIDLPGVQGRIDHLALDSRNDRLFVAALGNNSVEVLDLKTGKTLQSIRGLDEPQGLLYDPNSGELTAASGGDGTLRIFKCESAGAAPCRPAGTTPSLPDADNVRRDPRNGNVLVAYGDGGLAVFSAGKLAWKIPTGGHPESFQLQSKTPRLYANVPDAARICVIDRDRRAILANWPTGKRQANFPMALDEERHRLFVGFRRPAELVVYDTETGKERASVACVGDTDDLFFDATSGSVYVSGGEGFLDVFSSAAPGRLERIDRIPTANGARTCLFDPTGGRIFVAAPRRGTAPAQILLFKTRKPDSDGRSSK